MSTDRLRLLEVDITTTMSGNRSPSPDVSDTSTPPTLSPFHKIRLVVYHTLALIPSLVILGTTLWSSKAVMHLCNLRLLFPETIQDTCSPVMTQGVAVMVIVIGAVCWYASSKLIPVFWEVSFVVLKAICLVLHVLTRSTRFRDVSPMLLSLGMAFLRTLVVELLRIFGQEVSTLILIALAWQQHRDVQPNLLDTQPKCWTGMDDPRFVLALWLGCGWASAEVLAGSYQLYKFVPMYRTMGQPALDEEDLLTDYMEDDRSDDGEDVSALSTPSSGKLEEMTLDELILMREKTELEAQLGEYLENVPPAIITLWRLDSVLWQLGTCLLMSAAIVQAQGCASVFDDETPYRFVPFPALPSMRWTFIIIVLIHTISTLAWLLVLPRLGLTNITYSSLLVGLVLLSSGLGRWNVLK